LVERPEDARIVAGAVAVTLLGVSLGIIVGIVRTAGGVGFVQYALTKM
jgi:hypothetical protein